MDTKPDVIQEPVSWDFCQHSGETQFFSGRKWGSINREQPLGSLLARKDDHLVGGYPLSKDDSVYLRLARHVSNQRTAILGGDCNDTRNRSVGSTSRHDTTHTVPCTQRKLYTVGDDFGRLETVDFLPVVLVDRWMPIHHQS